MQISATERFANWAAGFSGCDGGDLSGAIWFCGIEYGGRKNCGDFLSRDVSEPGFIEPATLKKRLSPQYNRKAAKLYAALKGERVQRYFQVAKEDRLFDQESVAFKMNLYPLAFPKGNDELWGKDLYQLTNLPTKSLYRAWCQLYRFPQIRSWVEKNNPLLIIGTSKTYKDDFLAAFSPDEQIFEKLEHDSIMGRDIYWKPINHGRTLLVITPFLGGPHGLNSDSLLKEFADKINTVCGNYFGTAWLQRGKPNNALQATLQNCAPER